MKKEEYYEAKYQLLKQDYNNRLSERLAKQEEYQVSKDRRLGVSFLSSILGGLLIFLIFVYVIRLRTTNAVLPTFTNLLNSITNLDTIDIQSIFGSYTITADWGSFNFLRDIINNFYSPLVEISDFLLSSVYNLFIYIKSILQWILG